MIMKKLFKNLILTIVLVIGFSCEVTNLEPQNNPNTLSPDKFDVDLALNALQENLPDFFNSGNGFGMQVTRMVHMFGPLYDNAYTAASFDAVWTSAYADILADASVLIPAAEELGATKHVGIAKIIKAYVMITLVDLFGDVPYEEAFLGEGNLNPNVSTGAFIYTAAEALLNDAIVDLNATPVFDVDTDVYYGGDETKWITLANTLKMRIYLTTRLVDASAGTKFTTILAGGDFMNSTSEDFQFNYSTVRANPDSRHPDFSGNYVAGANEYMSNYYMNLLFFDQAVVDPRIRFYMYRQRTSNSTDVNEVSCIGFPAPTHYGPGDPFCQLINGYWGRDHGDESGIPPDDTKRTIWGLYPAGGKLDNSESASASQDIGAQGKGVAPILLSIFTDFWRSEAALTMGTTDNPRTMLENGIRGSMIKVAQFNTEIDYSYTTGEQNRVNSVMSTTNVNNYVNSVLADYDAATTNEQRLRVVMREYYKASWGNGYEVYNAYRRTGYPDDLQPTRQAAPGAFIRTFLYPSVSVNLNANIDQKLDNTIKVFWDDGSKSLD